MSSGSGDRPDAPGWYPDDGTGRMRRWDGARWTGESREMPPWMAGAKTAGRRRWPAHWVAFAVVTGFLFLGVSYKAMTSGVDLPDRTVHDTEFVEAASSLCRARVQPLKEGRPKAGTPEGRDPGTNEEVADKVEESANALSRAAGDLRDLADRSPDAPALQGWLADYDRYVALGFDYADAVREDSKAQRKITTEAAEVGTRVDLFAQANGLSACAFH